MAQNIFAEGMGAFDDAYARTQAMRDQIARVRGGRALAKGDRAGAAAAYGSEGLTSEVRQVQADDRRIADEQYQRSRQEVEDQRIQQQTELAATQRRVETLARVAQALKGVPAGQRAAQLQAAIPTLQSSGVDVAQLGSLTEDHLTDDQLDLFSGELEKQWQAVNLGNGGLGRFNNRTGETEVIREPDARPVIIGNGGIAVDPDTGQVVGRNPKTFAPKSGGGGRGGGRGGAGLPPPPAGWAPAK